MTGNNICRTDISKIETNRKKLRYPLAVRLAKNINDLLDKKGIIPPYEITPDILIGTQEYKIEDIINKISNGITDDDLLEIDTFYKNLQTNWDKKALLTRVIKELDKDLYKNSRLILKYCIKLYNLELTIYELIDFKIILMKAYMVQQNYLDAITIFFSIDEFSRKNLPGETKFKLLYNLAICYRETEQYDIAIEVLDFCNKLKIEKYSTNVLLMQANVYYSINNKNEAVRAYKKIIQKSPDINTLCLSKSNLAYILFEQKKIELAEKTINKALMHINDLDIITKCSILKNNIIISDTKEKQKLIQIEELFENLNIINSEKKNNDFIIEIAQNVLKTEQITVSFINIAKQYDITISSEAKEEIAKKYKNNSHIMNLLF